MKKLALAAALLSLTASSPVYAINSSPTCCACVVLDHGEDVVALFCVSPTNIDEEIAAEERCSSANQFAGLVCSGMSELQSGETTRQDVSASCVAELRAENIICPQAAAPALDTRALGALGGLLALLGIWGLRRRARLG